MIFFRFDFLNMLISMHYLGNKGIIYLQSKYET